MNLIELVRLGNNLENLAFDDIQENLLNRVDKIMNQSDIPAAGIDTGFRDRIQEKTQILQTVFESIDLELSAMKAEIQRQIEIQGQEFNEDGTPANRPNSSIIPNAIPPVSK